MGGKGMGLTSNAWRSVVSEGEYPRRIMPSGSLAPQSKPLFASDGTEIRPDRRANPADHMEIQQGVDTNNAKQAGALRGAEANMESASYIIKGVADGRNYGVHFDMRLLDGGHVPSGYSQSTNASPKDVRRSMAAGRGAPALAYKGRWGRG